MERSPRISTERLRMSLRLRLGARRSATKRRGAPDSHSDAGRGECAHDEMEARLQSS